MNFKNQFPYFQNNPKEIYLDAAATSLKPKCVLDAEYEYNVKIGANTHNNLFDNAYLANKIVDDVRVATANFIGAKNSQEIVFTSGATHALNQIAVGLKKILEDDDEIVLTKLEHSSNLLPWIIIAKEKKIKIKYLILKSDGSIDIDSIHKIITKKTKIVSFANVCNTMGAENDVQAIVEKIKQINSKAIIVIDAAQAISHSLTDVSAWKIDCLVFSAHKMFGPFGLGVLWAKETILEMMEPIFYGGGNNSAIELDNYRLAKIPFKFEAGTLNLSAIFAFKAALEFIQKISMQKIIEHLTNLKIYLREQVQKLDSKKFEFYNLTSQQPLFLFNVKGVNPQDFGAFLNKRFNISVRVGKHCARLSKYVIKTESSVRVSFSIYNTKNDIDTLIEALQHADDWIDSVL